MTLVFRPGAAMSVQINANQFSLKYVPDEDRMLFCVTISPEHEIGVYLTRRIARWLIDGLMKHAPEAQSAGEVARQEEAARQGKDNRPAQEEKPRALAVPPRLVREVKIAPRENGGLALVVNNGEQQIVLEVAANRILVVADIFLDLAGKAGWDFAAPPRRPVSPPAEEGETRKMLH